MVDKGKNSSKQSTYLPQTSPTTVVFKLLKDYFLAIVGAAIVALVLRVYVVEAFRIPTDYMAPALVPGDLIFVDKLAYSDFIGSKNPMRGDVVIFSFVADPTKDYIKRVIGVAGDKIALQDGKVLLNGKSISHPFEKDAFEEDLDGHTYRALWKGASEESRHMIEVTVPAGNIFVMGDNRAKGQDSRSWGFLPASSIKGKARVIWFSAGPAKPGQPVQSEDGLGTSVHVRWDRLLKKVN